MHLYGRINRAVFLRGIKFARLAAAFFARACGLVIVALLFLFFHRRSRHFTFLDLDSFSLRLLIRRLRLHRLAHDLDFHDLLLDFVDTSLCEKLCRIALVLEFFNLCLVPLLESF